MKKEVDCSRWVGCMFNKQGDLPIGLILGNQGNQQGSLTLHCPGGLKNTLLSQGCLLEAAQAMGTVGGIYISRT